LRGTSSISVGRCGFAAPTLWKRCLWNAKAQRSQRYAEGGILNP